MTDLKNSLKADAVGNLYRAAFYLAQGDQNMALSFLQKSSSQINLENLKPLLENPQGELTTEAQAKLWAEKTLDEYRKLLNLL